MDHLEVGRWRHIEEQGREGKPIARNDIGEPEDCPREAARAELGFALQFGAAVGVVRRERVGDGDHGLREPVAVERDARGEHDARGGMLACADVEQRARAPDIDRVGKLGLFVRERGDDAGEMNDRVGTVSARAGHCLRECALVADISIEYLDAAARVPEKFAEPPLVSIFR